MNNKQIKNISLALIFCHLIVGFVPYLKAIDKITTQFLYLSIINSVSLIFIFLNHKFFFKSILQITNKLVFRHLFIFSLWGLGSFFYALNTSEVIIEGSRILIYLISFFIFCIFLSIQDRKALFNSISLFFALILIIEVAWVLSNFFQYIKVTNSIARTVELRAFTGNINITAFAILLKTPFLIFLIEKANWSSLISKITLPITFFTIFLIGSRGANISSLAIILFLILILFLVRKVYVIKKKTIIYVIISFLFSSVLNFISFSTNDSINIISRTSNINTSSTQQRLRYYSEAFESITENPLFGIGLGNWKIFSIKEDAMQIDNYAVPYHVHNDFLELTAELGLVGFILFYGIYLYVFICFYKLFRLENLSKNTYLISIILILSLLIYGFDSALNFPFTRPVMQIPNLFFIGLSISIFNLNKITVLKRKDEK